MSAAPASFDPYRAERAIDRLLGHCELVNRMTAETQRVAPEKRLERKLGQDLTRRLLAGLSAAA